MKSSEFIRKRRVQLKISQYELASRLSIYGHETSHSRVSHWETGRNKPPLEDRSFRLALARSLELDVNSMMEELGYVITSDDISPEARLAADIVDALPKDARTLALDYLNVLQKRFGDGSMILETDK